MDKVIDNSSRVNYTIIDNYILNNAGLNGLEQIIYVHLKQYSIYTNRCFPGINKLAEEVGSTANTVRKGLKSLKEKGFIDIKQRFNDSNEYTLLPYPEYRKEVEKGDSENEGIAEVFKVYQSNINPVYGSIEREKLIGWYDVFEGSAGVIIMAINIAVTQGVRKLKYIDSILLNWHKCGIKTLDQCTAYQNQWDKKRSEGKNDFENNREDKEGVKGNQYDFSKYGDI